MIRLKIKLRNSIMAAYNWVDSFERGGIPSTALDGGEDIDGHQIYIGRAYHNEHLLPAKVIPGKHVAYVASDGKEHLKDNFQVLCEQRFDWVTVKDGKIPEDAIEGGRTAVGEILYIGRVHHEGSNTVGKVQNGVCCIPFGGKEIKYKEFEILVLRW